MKQGRWKIYLKRTVAGVVTLALIATALMFLTDLTERKDSDSKYASFFAEERDFDVLFFGTSHVLNAILPMELWEEYGITGYNMGGHSNTIATSYWLMELALEYTNPSVVVVDCMGISGGYKTASNFSYVHQSMDAFPLSVTKVRAVLDLLDDEAMERAIERGDVEETEERTPISLLWDFSVYHSRWSEITENDFQPEYNVSKGAEARNYVEVPQETETVSQEIVFDGDTVSIAYLERMIEDCQACGIEVLLVNLPYPASAEEQSQANRINDIAEEYEVDYINFLTMDVVDYNTDMADAGSHLNSSGARKVTNYLGAYIAERYGIMDKRKDEAYADWNEDYRAYLDYKNSCLRDEEELDVFLMLLADDDYDAVIELGNCAEALTGSDWYCGFLGNLGIDSAAVTEDISEIRISAGGERVLYTGEYAVSVEASTGSFQTEGGETSDWTVGSEGSFIRITVTEHVSGETVTVSSFDIP